MTGKFHGVVRKRSVCISGTCFMIRGSPPVFLRFQVRDSRFEWVCTVIRVREYRDSGFERLEALGTLCVPK